MSLRKAAAVLLGAACCLLASSALADDYEGGENGDQIYPVESTAIRMVRERVEVFVLQWGGPGGEHARVFVSAEFVLANESKVGRSILVAFPNTDPLERFRRFVDNREVEVEMRLDANDVPQWPYVSRVDFEPGQVRRVRVQYDAHAGGSNGYPETWTYILRTGAHWKGRIAEATVTVHFPMSMPPGGFGPFRAEAVKLRPEGYKVDGRTATWTFKDFKPNRDIDLEWSTESAFQASDPLKYALPEEAPGLQLEMWKHAWTRRGIRELEALRKAYPDSAEARKVDYYIARAWCYYYGAQDWDTFACSVHKAGLKKSAQAVVHYEAALKQPLPDPLRRDALAQLFVLYTKDLRDEDEADRVLAALKKEKLYYDEENRNAVILVAAASPRAGLALLKTVTCSQDREWMREKFRKSLEAGSVPPAPVAGR